MSVNRWVAGLCCLATIGASTAWSSPPRISIGVGFGLPVYHRPCYHGYGWGYGYYRPYPVYVNPPVVVQPAPVVVEQPYVVQPAPVVQPTPVAQPTYQAPPPRVLTPTAGEPVRAPVNVVSIQPQLQQLSNPDERARADAAMELGRMRAESAVEQLTATLAGDRSPGVRESAARALGLIGSPRALTALTHAAQADSDRDVRRSAQFAVEVIQTHQPR